MTADTGPLTVAPGLILARLHDAAAQAATEEEAREVADQIRAFVRRVRASRWQPYPWQHPHHHPEGWVSERVPGREVCDARCALLPRAVIPPQGIWLQRGGRGTGKTEGAARYVNDHVEGPACDPRVPGGHRGTIVAPTQADAVSSCVEGVSGLRAFNPGVEATTNREGTLARWPNGAVARVVGAHTPKDVDRLRAWTNVCFVWIEEAAAMVHLGDVLAQVPFTLRLGPRLVTVITTTPKNRPEVIALVEGHPDQPTIPPAAVQTWGRTEDADRLPDAMRTVLETRYAGTTLGRQELDGELIGDVEGALWVTDRPLIVDGLPNTDERPGIANDRVPVGAVGWRSHGRPASLAGGHALPPVEPPADAGIVVTRTIVAVDPPGGRTECGIVVVGAVGQHGYPLADLSLAGPPDTWARVALTAYYDFGADGIAAEHAYGGDMVTSVLQSAADALGVPCPPIFKVPTKVGKRLRAEPVQALYQQHRMHHVGILPGMEAEQTTWVPDESPESPNRVDALVHGATFLLLQNRPAQVANPARHRVTLPSTFRGR